MRVAFIGSVGIPNCYGGFESFLESVAPVLVSKGADVYVTCDRSRYPNDFGCFKGVKRVMIDIRANGPLSPLHDLVAFMAVLRKVQFVVVLGVSAGPLFLIMRLVAFLIQKKLIVNVDGVEWRRGKYSYWQKKLLFCFDFFAQISANNIVYDNAGLLPFIHKQFIEKSVLIGYPGDAVVGRLGVQMEQRSALTICRVEPENNLEMLIEGALCSALKSYTIIGNWHNSSYGRLLKEKYLQHPSLRLLDPIYDVNEIANYRARTAIYLHGHSVGGTNPSLVEMLSYHCHIACFDCVFNRETAGGDAVYFTDHEDLGRKINVFIQDEAPALRVLQNRYRSSFIADQYIELFQSYR